MITIIDYGVGNLASICNMLRKLHIESRVSSDPSEVARADKLILPGVGAFDEGMRQLEARGLRDALERRVMNDGVPVLGICLGMQLLSRGSEEGSLEGLGWVPADTVRFDFSGLTLPKPLPVPHMGWNQTDLQGRATLFDHANPSKFYFVHSYHLRCDDESMVSAQAEYGIRFTAAVEHEHVFGCQFHPEKSHRFGMALLRRFGEYRSC